VEIKVERITYHTGYLSHIEDVQPFLSEIIYNLTFCMPRPTHMKKINLESHFFGNEAAKVVLSLVGKIVGVEVDDCL
jgi:hypothetical protein